VDNGPEPVSGEGNRWLYEEPGLGAIRRRLLPGGALLVWSGFRSLPFEARARAAGFEAASVEIPLSRPGVAHHLYLLRPAAPEDPGLTRSDVPFAGDARK
jgi:hypothetical protein